MNRQEPERRSPSDRHRARAGPGRMRGRQVCRQRYWSLGTCRTYGPAGGQACPKMLSAGYHESPTRPSSSSHRVEEPVPARFAPPGEAADAQFEAELVRIRRSHSGMLPSSHRTYTASASRPPAAWPARHRRLCSRRIPTRFIQSMSFLPRRRPSVMLPFIQCHQTRVWWLRPVIGILSAAGRTHGCHAVRLPARIAQAEQSGKEPPPKSRNKRSDTE